MAATKSPGMARKVLFPTFRSLRVRGMATGKNYSTIYLWLGKATCSMEQPCFWAIFTQVAFRAWKGLPRRPAFLNHFWRML